MNIFLFKAGIFFTGIFLVGCEAAAPVITPEAPPTVTTPEVVVPEATVPEVVIPDVTTSENTPEGYISPEKAKEIALNHANISSSQATFLQCKLDFDDGRAEYDVEFYVGNVEYDYEINATTGDIISFDQEMETPRPSTPSTSVGQISADQAKEIALNHANISSSEAVFLKCQLDYDDGVAEYEVEFYVGNVEYDYEINATTGDIISFDQDMETPRPSNPSTSVGQISADQAKEIALNHANISESQASFLKCELDYDDGVAEYEVEFRVGNVEYEYEINATTGDIISFDRD